MNSRLQRGLIAGLAATAAVSVLDLANILLGPWAASFPRLLSFLLQMDGNMLAGWIAHFVVGAVILGPLYGLLCPRLPTGTPESKGIVFAVAAWLVMSLTVAPLSGLGPFAAAGGFLTIGWLLFTHIVFGGVLGATYGALLARERHASAHAAPVT